MDESGLPPEQRELARLLAQGMKYAGIATQFAITLVVLVWLGWKLDEVYGWSPWGSLLGIGVGLSVGLTALLRQVARLEKSERNKR